jgi:hypothetical protein
MAEQTTRRRLAPGTILVALVLAIAMTTAPVAGAQSTRPHGKSKGDTAHFVLNGLVQSKANGELGVYVASGKIGAESIHKVVETVSIAHLSKGRHARRHKRLRSASENSRGFLAHRAGHHAKGGLVVGDIVHLVGRVVSRNGSLSLEATHASIFNTRGEAVLGTVSSVTIGTSTSTLVVKTKAVILNGHAGGSNGGSLSIDATKAVVYIDGTLGQVSNLAQGETVVAVGESYNGSMVAVGILAFTFVPSVAWGHLSALSGTTLEVANYSGTSAVDASGASIFLNGVSGASLSQLSIGSFVLAIGPSGTSPLAADMVFDFNKGDSYPVGDNGGDQGDGQHQVALFGTVQSVSGSSVVVARQRNGGGQGGEGDHLRPADGGGTVSIDAGSATVSIDGAAGALTGLNPGDTVMVLGTAKDQGVVATALYAYDNAATIVAGRAGSITGSGLTISQEESSTAVDASSAAIYLDGTASSLASVADNDFVVAFGTMSSGNLTAAAVFAFNGGHDS